MTITHEVLDRAHDFARDAVGGFPYRSDEDSAAAEAWRWLVSGEASDDAKQRVRAEAELRQDGVLDERQEALWEGEIDHARLLAVDLLAEWRSAAMTDSDGCAALTDAEVADRLPDAVATFATACRTTPWRNRHDFYDVSISGLGLMEYPSMFELVRSAVPLLRAMYEPAVRVAERVHSLRPDPVPKPLREQVRRLEEIMGSAELGDLPSDYYGDREYADLDEQLSSDFLGAWHFANTAETRRWLTDWRRLCQADKVASRLRRQHVEHWEVAVGMTGRGKEMAGDPDPQGQVSTLALWDPFAGIVTEDVFAAVMTVEQRRVFLELEREHAMMSVRLAEAGGELVLPGRDMEAAVERPGRSVPDGYLPVKAFTENVPADTLRKACQADRIRGRKVRGQWHYLVADVQREYGHKLTPAPMVGRKLSGNRAEPGGIGRKVS